VHFPSQRGRPALAPRLVAGLLYLQHTFDASDEAAVNTWVENPYWQHFCGEVYLQTELPMDPSSLTRWSKRISEDGVETLLAATIEAARKGGVVRGSSAERVIVDSTVMPKAIAHPTDSRLLERSRAHLVKAAADNGIALRQNYSPPRPGWPPRPGGTHTPTVPAHEEGRADPAYLGRPHPPRSEPST
jgi:IS5 family transposase